MSQKYAQVVAVRPTITTASWGDGRFASLADADTPEILDSVAAWDW